MTPPKTFDDLRARLDEALTRAKQDMDSSNQAALNSYGAGYDTAVYETLRAVLRTINGEEDGVV